MKSIYRKLVERIDALNVRERCSGGRGMASTILR